MRDFEVVNQNLRVALRFFGGALETGDIARLAGADAIYSGLDYGVFNIALLSEAANGEKALASRIASCAEYYRGKSRTWSFWLGEELLDRSARIRARELFDTYGFRVISQPPAMLTERLHAPQRPLPKLECVPVDSENLRHAFAEITAVCFDIPYTVARAVYTPERAWTGDYRGYVGLLQGKPVAIAAVAVSEAAVGVYSVGTLPEHRRCGYGEAIIRRVIEAAGVVPEKLVLQSSDAGHHLYRRMGFRDVGRFSVYLTK